MTTRATWPEGYALVEFEAIDSTNEEARRRAASGETGPLWIRAARQTAGRGRRGRAWQSPPGNLAASLLLRPMRSPGEAAQLSFVAALASTDSLQTYAGATRIEVKWPNDVLAQGRKIAGILLESASGNAGRLDWLIVGIGINIAHHPSDTEFPATSLAHLGVKAPPPGDVLVLLAHHWAKWYERWTERGFDDIRDAWLARAANIGTRIRARLQNEETTGVFEGIDASGALILREAQDRVRLIAAGEVFF